MMETPHNFNSTIVSGSHTIRYVSLQEIGQGGPLVGRLIINGKELPDKLFGGPGLAVDSVLFIPLFIRRFCISGFRLVRIDLDTCVVSFLTGIKDLIWILDYQNQVLTYAMDMYKRELAEISVTL